MSRPEHDPAKQLTAELRDKLVRRLVKEWDEHNWGLFQNRMQRPLIEVVCYRALIGDILEESTWKQVAAFCEGTSLSYIGKQSHHLFGARDLLRLLTLATRYLDVLVLEVPPPSLTVDLPEVDELTRTEMRDAGFHVALVDEPGGRANPITHRMSFRLDAWDATGRRTLFRYPRWTVWPQPFLVGLAQLLELEALYFHSELDEFVPVEHDASESDCHENVTFMLFSRTAH